MKILAKIKIRRIISGYLAKWTETKKQSNHALASGICPKKHHEKTSKPTQPKQPRRREASSGGGCQREAELTGSVAKRSSEAGNPKVTSVWLRYRAQCSRFPAFANAPPSLHEQGAPPSEFRTKPATSNPGENRQRRREAATALTSCRRATPVPAAAETRPALRGRMSVASAAKGRAADLGSGGWLGFYPEVEARRRGHPRRARGERDGERSGS